MDSRDFERLMNRANESVPCESSDTGFGLFYVDKYEANPGSYEMAQMIESVALVVSYGDGIQNVKPEMLAGLIVRVFDDQISRVPKLQRDKTTLGQIASSIAAGANAWKKEVVRKAGN